MNPPIRVGLLALAILAAEGNRLPLFAQNWSFDARKIALGGVGGSENLATAMIDEQREYRSIVLPFGLLQVLRDFDTFDPDSSNFDMVKAFEYAASPIHFVVGRDDSSSGQTLFVNDIRNAELSRDLSRYRGFAPANNLRAEGLATPSFGGTFKVARGERGSFQGIYVGAGPYLSARAIGAIDEGLTSVLASGVNVPSARYLIANTDQVQAALAVTGGYRGRFAWPAGIGSGSDREGLYVAANYNYLRGFRYGDIDMAITMETDRTGLISLTPTLPPIVITTLDADRGTGFSLDAGAGAVVGNWEFGFGARGIANRIDWSGLEQKRYLLQSLTSGDSDFQESGGVPAGDVRVELPVDYRANLAYATDKWTAAAEVGHGLGGGSFHGGYEHRLGPAELRGGARYTTTKWNPTGGVGVDLSRRVSLDFAVYGTTTNIERKRQMALAVSMRFNGIR